MGEFRILFKDENALLNAGVCPFCHDANFLKGPEGGLATNIECEYCGARFNFKHKILPSELLRKPTRGVFKKEKV